MGKNPLAVYVLSVLFGKTLAVWKLASGISVKQLLYSSLAFLHLPGEMQSLLYPLLLLAAMWALARALRSTPLRL
jgi:predicted acyltransferase